VITAAVLLDRRLALGALLGVGGNPVSSFGVVSALLEPPLDQLAWRGLVVRVGAAKAKAVATSTFHGGHHLAQGILLDPTFDDVGAVGGWAPLVDVFIFHVGTVEEIAIAIGQVGSDEQVERAGVEDAATAFRGALDPCCLAFVLDLLLQVVSIAFHAVSMAALHGEGFDALFIFAANVADEARDGFQLGGFIRRLTQAGSLKNGFRPIHVVFEKAFLVPSKMTQHYGSILLAHIENHVNLVNHVILLSLDIVRLVDLERNNVSLLLGLLEILA
jgi:hypothetical protein